MRSMRSTRSLLTAASIDRRAFGIDWDLDVTAIREACRATPSHRIRLAVTAADEPAGYMITGRSGSSGFVQRLAVDPVHQGQGIGNALMQAGLRWLGGLRVDDILVNTHLDNVAALQLYDSWGFHRLEDNLQVMELDLGISDRPITSSGDGT
ncbi:MAG: GNAT family N-acetyltransferase, partial [Actinomycetota bacterium]